VNALRMWLGLAWLTVVLVPGFAGTNTTLDVTERRVLIVTTEQYEVPPVWQCHGGEYVATDLAAAGYPFDVVTYGRFISMPLDRYDVVILNGHTSPTPVSDVAAKCQAALQEGRKVFVNGDLPYKRYDATGKLIESLNYSLDLFDVQDTGNRKLNGALCVPPAIEKDPGITSAGFNDAYVRVFSFRTPPDMAITASGNAIGFLYPQGGALNNGSTSWLLNVLDYGKVVAYLRYGTSAIVGFANDRIEGQPIVSFEVHGETPYDPVSVNAVNALAADFSMPLYNLLVYCRLNADAIAHYNSISNPFLLIGSHSRTHPMDWPSVPDVYYETRDALTDQRGLIPATGNYFDFSGAMNPTTEQIDQIYSAGVVFGAGGGETRGWKLPSGDWVHVQRLPLRRTWFANLSRSLVTPFCLSQTLDDDNSLWQRQGNYPDEVETDFALNTKYGLYTYGYIHDCFLNPNYDYYTGGVHMSVQIRSAMQFLKSQNVKFIPTDELILRLRDFIAGWIDYDTNPDGSLQVTVYRPSAKANQVKIQSRDGLAPVASGDSVVSQHLVGDILYIDLLPEVTSTFYVGFEAVPPDPPTVVAPQFTNGNLAASWSEPPGPWHVETYYYAVGSTPGDSDAAGWTATGTDTSFSLTDLPLCHMQDYYVSVYAVSDYGLWSDLGLSAPIRADLTPPDPPVVTAPSQTASSTQLSASWQAADSESGIVNYRYAVGSSPGATDALGWTEAGPVTQAVIGGLHLTVGNTYYVSVQAENGAGSWSASGSSNGIRVVTDGTIGRAKETPDGGSVLIWNASVTAVFPDGVYIEQCDRSAGIRLTTNASCTEGDVVELTGTIGMTCGERVVWDAQFSTCTSGIPLRPLAMANHSVGGGPYNAYTPGISGASGLSNIGLLIRTCGRVTDSCGSFVYIDDGSCVQDGSGGIGVKVDCSDLTSPHKGDYVYVTGISGVEMAGQSACRLIRPRRQSDITVVPGG